ncbi:MAG: DNA repair protein RadA [Bacteroidales bacterium]|jgi:DNA repair protein RadA/Sms|nr:DNA repair protein RadA [Bacteroidales bacterium]
MAKSKAVYFCKNCGTESSKWIGKCLSCGEWNTYIEHVVTKSGKQSQAFYESEMQIPQKISEIKSKKEGRISTRINELDRILGGGLVTGSMILIGGEPGIGKSTLALQVALKLEHLKILYISGEESPQQIKMRAERLNLQNDNCFILSETLLENIFTQTLNINPDLLIIDSIQTLYSDKIESSAGTVTQVRESAASLLKFAKEKNVSVFLIGHITKDGNIAGPKVLEHIVDTVLQFEGDHNHMYRILRTTKNRFGSTSELGIFEMGEKGLREVSNPSEILITQSDDNLSGTAIASTINGARPLLIEIQALASSAAYGTPQRSSTGFDNRRLGMLLAVLEKRAGFRLAQKDVFLNIAGGIKVDDPATDLAVIASVLSSNLDLPIDKDVCFAGEVGLTGEIRPVARLDQRISEADKLGFKKIYISRYNSKGIEKSKYKIEIVKVSRVEELFRSLFKKN